MILGPNGSWGSNLAGGSSQYFVVCMAINHKTHLIKPVDSLGYVLYVRERS